jgi:hypothetical protein
MSRTARAAGALLAATVLVACGGGSKPASKAADGAPAPTASGTGQAGSGTPAASGSATGGPGATATPTGGSTATSGTGTTPASTPTRPAGTASPSTKPSPTAIFLNATLSKTCVRPGGTQSLTMRARPNMKVIVNTSYADGKDGSTYGGRFTKDQFTDANGRYTVSWTVALTAPQGDAATSVGAVDESGTGYRRLPFRVAATC